MFVRPCILLLGLSLLASSVRSQTPLSPAPSREQVRDALDRGAYADAEAAAVQLVAVVATSRGEASLDAASASDLLVEALLRNGKSGAPATRELAERVLALKQKLAGADALDTAVSAHNLGDILIERGDHAEALRLHERGLAIRSRQLPASSEAIADSLDHIVATLLLMERLDRARLLLERALPIREAHAAEQPRALARTLELHGWRQRFRGEYAAARATLERLQAVWRGLPGEHPDFANVLKLAGDLHWLRDEHTSGRDTWLEAAALIARRLSPNHPAMIGVERRLALAFDGFGDRSRASQLMTHVLPLAEANLGPCHPDRLGLRGYAASRRAYDGAFLEARSELQRVQRGYEQCFGAGDSRAVTMVYNRALMAARMGDFAEAERLHQQTIRDWSARLGPRHAYMARAWDGLAQAAGARGQYARARQLYARALRARRHPDQPDTASVAWTLTNLARALMGLGELTAAHRHVEEALEIFAREGASDEPDYLARALALHGEIESRRGDASAARASFLAALAEREKIFGASHPLTAQSRADLASALLRLHDETAALDGALAAETAGRDHLRFTIRYLPERQAMNYAASRPRGLDLALSVGATAPSPIGSGDARADTPRLLDAVIQSRGVILDELAARARAVDTADTSAVSLATAAIAARQRFANLLVRSLQERVSRPLLDEARQKKEEAEQALAERSGDARAETARVRIGLADVRAALPPEAALVSFVRYDRTLVAPQGPTRWRPPVPSYAAFVLRADRSDPILVPLGAAASIETLVTSWHDEASGRTLAAGATLADAEAAYRRAGLRVRRAIWDPLAPHLTNVARIVVVPDGQLNIVSLAALPSGAGRYLADEPATIHYLSTERDLMMAAGGTHRTSVLAVGGVTFDGQTTPPAQTSQRSACEAFSRIRFPALPGSRGEVADIRRVWPDGDARDVTVLSGTAATETAVKRAASGHRVVHLATHGFFLGGQCIPGLPGTRGVAGLVGRASATAADTDNPLLLSGLALAWANRREKARTAQDDGILTAEEIAGLNLQGTEWAVLSACDTGLGEIKAGEGVFGLRRAFQIAGARTVIMSLWAVEDGAARVWMRALYDGRFQKQLTTADAVRNASRTVLADRRAKRQSTHPFYWGGFVAAGDWR